MHLYLETKLQKITGVFALLAIFLTSAPAANAQTAWEVRSIVFPVIGTVTYWDDFGAPRDGGRRSHEGNDLMGRKMLPLIAATDGKVRVTYPEASYGYSITLEDTEGYTYHYIHVNNDTPGTDNGKGDGAFAYAVDVDDGATVVQGQLLGWMGDSGNAETTQAHLHFEIRRPDRTPISPYGSLKAAKKITAPVSRPQQPNEILPFGEFGGGSFIATGNADADADPEIAIGAGIGGGPHVRVVNEDGTEIIGFFPYLKTFRGGVDVAMADINGDGLNEIITAPHSKNIPLIKIYSLAGAEVGSFLAYDRNFQGGVNVTAADINNDGSAEIITSPGKGGGPHIKIFNAIGTEISGFFAYDQGFRGGVDVAAYSKSGQTYIATAPSTGGGPHIKVFDANGGLRSEFSAYDGAHRGGVRVTISGSSNNGPNITTVPLLGGSQIKKFSSDGTFISDDWGFEAWWMGSWDIASYNGKTFVSTGPNTRRRASIRPVTAESFRFRE